MNIEDKYYSYLDKVYQLNLAMDKLIEARLHVEYANDTTLHDELVFVIKDTDKSIKFYNRQIDSLKEEITR